MNMPTDSIRPSDSIANSPAQAKASDAPRPGAILTVRHGQPNLSRKVLLSAAEYAAWWARYEETGLKPGQTPPAALMDEARKAAVILVSTRIRAIETAEALTQGLGFEIDAALIEAPLPPPAWPDWLRLSPFIWGIVARFWWWYFNQHGDQESRAEAEARAAGVAARLVELSRAGDVMVVAHGFFNTLIRRSLKASGWKVVEKAGGLGYWCHRRLER